ncbi:MAG: insulinase family protein [Nitrospirota bacterium]|nr:insulinase family protein [Nitrospirota bacterium]
MYRKLVLDNGLRVVTERMPAFKSVTVGIWVNVGSRDEGAGEEGLSHFLEHMFFKGTTSRSATQISREIDALGGELNAFTSRETTTFYVKVLDQHIKPAVALLSDLFRQSRFASKEVEKEKQVVLEEIRMVQDDPEDLVQELHTELAMKRHPLGRSILGCAQTIQGLRRAHLLRYVRTHYHPQQTVIAVAGSFNLAELAPLLDKALGTITQTDSVRSDRWPSEVCGGLVVRKKALEQAHLCLGLPGVALDHKDRYGAYALNALLGGSVSSRLFQEVRERRGLAYSIYSYLSSYSDSGMLTIYAATRPKEAARVVELISREIRRLRTKGVGGEELERTKNQMKGNLMLSLENSQSRMSKLAKDELHQRRYTSLEEMLTDIDRVNGEQLLRLSRELFDLNRLSVTALGTVSRNSLQAAVS